MLALGGRGGVKGRLASRNPPAVRANGQCLRPGGRWENLALAPPVSQDELSCWRIRTPLSGVELLSLGSVEQTFPKVLWWGFSESVSLGGKMLYTCMYTRVLFVLISN